MAVRKMPSRVIRTHPSHPHNTADWNGAGRKGLSAALVALTFCLCLVSVRWATPAAAGTTDPASATTPAAGGTVQRAIKPSPPLAIPAVDKDKRARSGGSVAATDGNSFMEVNNAGQLVWWIRPSIGEGFQRRVVGEGWGTARLITSLGRGDFLEVKRDGRLSNWIWNGQMFVEHHRGTGWGNVRLIAGLTPLAFLAVRTDGALIWWKWGNGGFFPHKQIGNGWGTARLLAGLGEHNGEPRIMEVKTNGLLSQWLWINGLPYEYNKGQGWGTARLIAGLTLSTGPHWDSFMEVKADGRLSEWSLTSSGTSEINRGSGWGNARLIG
ncbi:hypothetical protein GCM10010411_35610 [Actinomadura fulvescens]|uniref:Uncharacterized protein n=2 Tax=Actinomadura fulvescens TaxID=46160 RepID=A0ABP6C4K2_9ACTN